MQKENKRNIYETTLTQIRALLENETRPLPAMANICAVLKENFNFFWVGFYLVDGNELVLGPFQGPVACMTIRRGRGVCGAAWNRGETIVVEDVEQFPGHIACNASSSSEIVVPMFGGGEVVGVLDIDSDRLSEFDDTDAQFLGELMSLPFVERIRHLYTGK